jgi:hypothetical protein
MIEDPIKKPFPHNIIRPEKQEFTQWYERFFLQSPRLASLQYDDEKMYEAWKAGYNMGLAKGTKLIEEDNKDDCV